MSDRIRWEPYSPNACLLGYVGTHEDWLFQIFPANDDADDRRLALMTAMPNAAGDFRYSEDVSELKAEAERWLSEFTASLGAIFPAAKLPRDDRGRAEVTCGQCGEGHRTNCYDDEIECYECDARRCPHCGGWYGGK